MICNLTRFPSNNARLARNPALIDGLVKCGKSKNLDDRVWSIRSFQNLASDSSSKVILANSQILTLLSICSMRKDYDEQLAAVATIYNLSTEPGAVVPLTNTGASWQPLSTWLTMLVSTPDIRRMACDALATIGALVCKPWLDQVLSLLELTMFSSQRTRQLAGNGVIRKSFPRRKRDESVGGRTIESSM
jgi:hypothetical protein